MAKRYLEALGNLDEDMVQRLRIIARVGLEAFGEKNNCDGLEDVLSTGDGSVDVNDSFTADLPDAEKMDQTLITCSDVTFHDDGHITEIEQAYNHLLYLGTMENSPESHRHALYVGDQEVDFEDVQRWVQEQRIPEDFTDGLKRMEFSIGDVVMFHNNHPHRLVSVDGEGREYGDLLDPRQGDNGGDDEDRPVFRHETSGLNRVGLFFSIGSPHPLSFEEIQKIASSFRTKNPKLMERVENEIGMTAPSIFRP